jgi:hypothetical protein
VRRGLTITTLAAACAVALPGVASAQTCDPPKAVYLANAEFANASYLFAGQTLDALSATLTAQEGALRNLVTGGVAGAATYAGVAAQYPLKLVRAGSTEPPECARRAPARRTRRASAGRRR